MITEKSLPALEKIFFFFVRDKNWNATDENIEQLAEKVSKLDDGLTSRNEKTIRQIEGFLSSIRDSVNNIEYDCNRADDLIDKLKK